MSDQPDPLETNVTPGDILRRSESDPILHACMRAWKQGDLPWEQAMMNAALALSKRNSELLSELTRQVMRQSIRTDQPVPGPPDAPRPRCGTCEHPYDQHSRTRQRDCLVLGCKCPHYLNPEVA